MSICKADWPGGVGKVIRFTVGWSLVFLLGGCNGGAPKPKPVSLKAAEQLERDGKRADAVIAYGKVLRDLKEREDYESLLARAKIYSRLFRLRVWVMAQEQPQIISACPNLAPLLKKKSGVPFLGLCAQADLRLLTEVSPEEAKTEACARLAGIFLVSGVHQ